MRIQQPTKKWMRFQRLAWILPSFMSVLFLSAGPEIVWAKETNKASFTKNDPALTRVMTEIQRGRETGEAGYFSRAEKWLSQMPKEGKHQGKIIGLQAWVALFQHQFQKAADLAKQAIELEPSTAFHYGVQSDAALELGNYEQSLAAAQKMLDLKPDQGALSRAAHLRDLHGDTEGAISLWKQAIQAGAPVPENTAWCQVELGDVYFNQGQIEAAKKEYLAALDRHPGNHRALARLARLHAALKQFKRAKSFYQQAISVVPLPEYTAALGDLYLVLGRPEAAEIQFAQVVLAAKLDRLSQNNANRDLALFYAEQGRNLNEAVIIAEQAILERKDIATYDMLAWVYYKTGRYPEAETAITQALRLGTKNAVFHFHAGMIAKALGKENTAQKHLKTALHQNPYFDLKHTKTAKQQLIQFVSTKGEPS